MPKYWGKQIFTHGDSPKWVKSKRRRERERKKERPKVGHNNGQLRISTSPHVAHAKPPGPIDTHTDTHKDTHANIHVMVQGIYNIELLNN